MSPVHDLTHKAPYVHTLSGAFARKTLVKVRKAWAVRVAKTQVTSPSASELACDRETASMSPNGRSPLGSLTAEVGLDHSSPVLISDKALSHGSILKSPLSSTFRFDTIESAIEEIAAGRFVVVLDDESRENEGDLVAAAQLVTTESIAFMVENTSGVICVGMKGEDLDRLQLPLMVPPSQNTDAKCTAFTVTVDLRKGTTTGISAGDRAKTLNALADGVSQPSDFRRPGHIFPLRQDNPIALLYLIV